MLCEWMICLTHHQFNSITLQVISLCKQQTNTCCIVLHFRYSFHLIWFPDVKSAMTMACQNNGVVIFGAVNRINKHRACCRGGRRMSVVYHTNLPLYSLLFQLQIDLHISFFLIFYFPFRIWIVTGQKRVNICNP